MKIDDDFEQEFHMIATEAVLSRDAYEAADHIRGLARRVAQKVTEVNTQQLSRLRATDLALREFMQENSEDFLDDPEIMKRVQARDRYLIRTAPGMSDLDRWHRAAADVRRTYGDANQRVIRGMRQSRLGARLASDPESYTFDMGSEDILDNPVEADEVEIAADRSNAIMQLRIANMGTKNEVDKQRYAEMELRRRQR